VKMAPSLTVVAHALILAWVFLMPSIGKADPRQFRITLQSSKGSWLFDSIALFKERVEAGTNGELQFELFPGSKLYKPNQVRGAVTSGEIEMGAALLTEYAGPIPAAGIFSQPYMLSSDALVDTATAPGSAMRALIDAAVLQQTGARVLWWTPLGTGVMVSKGSPMLTPEDSAGKKIRVSSIAQTEFIKQCGGIPVDATGDKQYAILKNGEADASMTGITVVADRKLWEVTDTLTITHDMDYEFIVVINEAVWQSLTASQRQIMADAAREVEQLYRKNSHEDERRLLAIAAQNGMKIVEMNTEQIYEWKTCATPQLEVFLERSGTLGHRVMEGYKQVMMQSYIAPQRKREE
jgi:C4-dicarboxylate-binding protein DctP